MRNFDAFALAVIVVVLLGFSEVHLASQPLPAQNMSGQNMLTQDFRGQAASLRASLRSQRTVWREQIREQLRSQIRILKCQSQ